MKGASSRLVKRKRTRLVRAAKPPSAKARSTGTDWARLDALTDAEIRAAIERDPDARPTTPEFLKRARLVYPSGRKHAVTIRLDADVLNFFTATGPGYRTRINAVLRRHMRATGRRQ